MPRGNGKQPPVRPDGTYGAAPRAERHDEITEPMSIDSMRRRNGKDTQELPVMAHREATLQMAPEHLTQIADLLRGSGSSGSGSSGPFTWGHLGSLVGIIGAVVAAVWLLSATLGGKADAADLDGVKVRVRGMERKVDRLHYEQRMMINTLAPELGRTLPPLEDIAP